jgi:GNAT superfamily N-acetyltransferase
VAAAGALPPGTPSPARRPLRSPAGVEAWVRPWPDLPGTAQLVIVGSLHGLAPLTVRSWLSELRDDGWTAIRTGALGREPRRVFDRLGFAPCQELVLLRLEMDRWQAPPPNPLPVRRVRVRGGTGRRHRSELAVVDRAAFGLEWRLDADGIDDATSATPGHRVAAAGDGATVGYAITGRAGREGFLQRLAVDPAHQRRGIGTALVADAIGWLRRRRVGTVMVNTHGDNAAALALYERLGFVRLDQGLVVLELALASIPAGAP